MTRCRHATVANTEALTCHVGVWNSGGMVAKQSTKFDWISTNETPKHNGECRMQQIMAITVEGALDTP